MTQHFPTKRLEMTLSDRLDQEEGWVYMTGMQALVRLPIQQARRDKAAGLNTGGYISGYRGSPVGRYDVDLWQADKILKEHNVVFQPGLNEDMAATAKHLATAGMLVMPHFPARIIADKAMLADWIARYQGEAGVDQGLILAGNPAQQSGDFDSSMQLLETGLFDKAGFKRLHIAGQSGCQQDFAAAGTGGIMIKEEIFPGQHTFESFEDSALTFFMRRGLNVEAPGHRDHSTAFGGQHFAAVANNPGR